MKNKTLFFCLAFTFFLFFGSFLYGEIISGTVTHGGSGLANVIITGLPGSPTTDGSGAYSGTVDSGWGGTATPVLSGYIFSPDHRDYHNVRSDQTGQDYTASLAQYTISGTVTYEGSGQEGVLINLMPGLPVTDATGFYSGTVDTGWSGTVYPLKAGFKFTPTHTVYSNISSDLTNQDYTAGISFNPPDSYLILPEAIWAPASGGGTWMTEVQIIDFGGGSEVSVYFAPYGDSRRGPFSLWTGPGIDQSVKYDNILQTIETLDSGYSYYGRVGAIEFETQDVGKRIHVMARTFNGTYSKTLQALNVAEANTASISRQMVIQNLTSDASYRSAAGLFNTSNNTITVELSVKDSAGGVIGAAFSRTLGPKEFTSFNPFAEAGAPYPTYSHDNTYLLVNPNSGTGKIICFGATANNITNDPAAHIAVQGSFPYENSPSDYQVLPEIIWAPASGGGTWVSEVQITDFAGGSEVSVYFTPLGESRRGPFLLWTGPGLNYSVKYSNLLATLDGIDAGYNYYAKVGVLEFVTQDSSHKVDVTARTLNGNYSKTFQGLNYVEANTATSVRQMVIQNLSSDSAYRSAVGCCNLTGDSLTVDFSLVGADGNVIGSTFTRTIAGNEFQSFNPFALAGVPYPSYSYDNVWLYVNPTSGTGEIMCYGATSNNISNDPASHVAVQYK
jgi:hypothetical protein